MVENFGGTLNLILFLINLLGVTYYGFLTVFSPNSLVTRYDLGEKSLTNCKSNRNIYCTNSNNWNLDII